MKVEKKVFGGQTGFDTKREMGGECAERDSPHWWNRSGGVVMAMQQKDNAIRSVTCRR